MMMDEEMEQQNSIQQMTLKWIEFDKKIDQQKRVTSING
ncbi:unnamed protein product [Paramecium sonneborni]|uniref:Uncharacterized protein n=1 Tax=Paramecium sonneborni TaxID=65129 RepID=A0A8S1RCS1_9CILI|nr:unnamed protein product [Paramecium sonneborni]